LAVILFSVNQEHIMFTVISRHQGIDRTFKADTKFDAIFLFDALTKSSHVVEMWQGATLVQTYSI
jgi:hypothetical protein